MGLLQEIVFETGFDNADEISDALLELGALSVTVEDAAAHGANEQPIFGEPGAPIELQAWPNSRVAALLAAHVNAQGFWKDFCTQNPAFESAPFEIRQVDDRDWVSETQRQFTPLVIRNSLWVGPHWTDPPARLSPPSVVIRLDPGMAFGTGSHATTQLCLDFMLQRFQTGQAPARVLDMGCGSGILAIAAAKLGAKEIIAVDIDPTAVKTAEDNAANNAVQIRCQQAEYPIEGRFDLVVANILSQPLKLLAPALVGYAKPGASLFLSGILARQADELLDAYRPLAGHLPAIGVLGEKDGWVCIGTHFQSIQLPKDK